MRAFLLEASDGHRPPLQPPSPKKLPLAVFLRRALRGLAELHAEGGGVGEAAPRGDALDRVVRAGEEFARDLDAAAD